MKDILNKKKLTDIFLRKEDRKKQKEEIHQKKVQVQQFDQSYYDCEIVYTQLITSLIKVTAIVNSGSNAGQFLPLNCKWYIKNKFDFKQIQDVRGACFQPCLDDIGNIICVQAQPFIQGKKYTGITIMKQTIPLHLDKKLETLSNQFFIQTKTKFNAKIQAIFSQNPNYEFLEYPLQAQIIIEKTKISVIRKSNQELICQFQINEQFPQIDFIRKSYSSIIFNCNQIESMRISFLNNFDRDLFVLIVRSIPRRKFVQKKLKKPQEQVKTKNNKFFQREQMQMQREKEKKKQIEKQRQRQKEKQRQMKKVQQISTQMSLQNQMSGYNQKQKQMQKEKQKIQRQKQKSQREKQRQRQRQQQRQRQKLLRQRQTSQNTTMLILKIDDLNKQIKNLKRKNQDMTANFNSQRNAKILAQKDLQQKINQMNELKLKAIHSESLQNKVKSLNQQNKFYFSQISLIKNQIKEKVKEIKSLQNRLKNLQNEIQMKNVQINELKELKDLKSKSNGEGVEQDVTSLRVKNDNLQSEIQNMKEQLQKLQDQNNLLRKKVSSIASQKNLQSPTKSAKSSDSLSLQKNNKKIKQLQMKISNLQMLLKYKSGQKGNQALGLHQLVNILTENISQKEQQILSLKKINKELLKKIQ